MDIVHSDRPLPPRLVKTEQALIVVSKAAAADGRMQMYVFPPAPAERAALLKAGHSLGTMAVLPAGSQLNLIVMARNRGALMAEIISVVRGGTFPCACRPGPLSAATRRVPERPRLLSTRYETS